MRYTLLISIFFIHAYHYHASAETILRVAAAANFRPALTAIEDSLSKQEHIRLRVSYGSSGKLFAQIQQGAPFDVFLSADEDKVDKLVDLGLADPESRLTYALGRLAVVTTASNTDIVSTLQHAAVKKLAIANPALAPYGKASEEVLDRLEALDKLRKVLVVGENIAQSFHFVRSGNTQMGFVSYAHYLALDDKDRYSVWLVPETYHNPIKQDGVRLFNSSKNSAQRFLAFLQSDQVKRQLTELGYGFPKENNE